MPGRPPPRPPTRVHVPPPRPPPPALETPTALRSPSATDATSTPSKPGTSAGVRRATNEGTRGGWIWRRGFKEARSLGVRSADFRRSSAAALARASSSLDAIDACRKPHTWTSPGSAIGPVSYSSGNGFLCLRNLFTALETRKAVFAESGGGFGGGFLARSRASKRPRAHVAALAGDSHTRSSVLAGLPFARSDSCSSYSTLRHSSGAWSRSLPVDFRKRSDPERPSATSRMNAHRRRFSAALLETHTSSSSSSASWKCETCGVALRQYLRSAAPRRSAVRAWERGRGGGTGEREGADRGRDRLGERGGGGGWAEARATGRARSPLERAENAEVRGGRAGATSARGGAHLRVVHRHRDGSSTTRRAAGARRARRDRKRRRARFRGQARRGPRRASRRRAPARAPRPDRARPSVPRARRRASERRSRARGRERPGALPSGEARSDASSDTQRASLSSSSTAGSRPRKSRAKRADFSS